MHTIQNICRGKWLLKITSHNKKESRLEIKVYFLVPQLIWSNVPATAWELPRQGTCANIKRLFDQLMPIRRVTEWPEFGHWWHAWRAACRCLDAGGEPTTTVFVTALNLSRYTTNCTCEHAQKWLYHLSSAKDVSSFLIFLTSKQIEIKWWQDAQTRDVWQLELRKWE